MVGGVSQGVYYIQPYYADSAGGKVPKEVKDCLLVDNIKSKASQDFAKSDLGKIGIAQLKDIDFKPAANFTCVRQEDVYSCGYHSVFNLLRMFFSKDIASEVSTETPNQQKAAKFIEIYKAKLKQEFNHQVEAVYAAPEELQETNTRIDLATASDLINSNQEQQTCIKPVQDQLPIAFPINQDVVTTPVQQNQIEPSTESSKHNPKSEEQKETKNESSNDAANQAPNNDQNTQKPAQTAVVSQTTKTNNLSTHSTNSNEEIKNIPALDKSSSLELSIEDWKNRARLVVLKSLQLEKQSKVPKNKLNSALVRIHKNIDAGNQQIWACLTTGDRNILFDKFQSEHPDDAAMTANLKKRMANNKLTENDDEQLNKLMDYFREKASEINVDEINQQKFLANREVHGAGHSQCKGQLHENVQKLIDVKSPATKIKKAEAALLQQSAQNNQVNVRQ